MTTRAEQKEATRRALLDAALRLSAEKGIGGLSLRTVSKEAGIAPTSFYRHFHDLDELGMALVDEVGMSLRQLVRQARRGVRLDTQASVVRISIHAFMELVEKNANLVRLLLGNGSGSSPKLRRAIAKEVDRFIDDLVEDLEFAAKLKKRPLAHIRMAAEAMVTVAFNIGAGAIDLPPEARQNAEERIVQEVRMIMRGAESMAETMDTDKH